MDILQELTKIIPPNKARFLDTIGRNDKTDNLYRLISSGKSTTQISKVLYDKEQAGIALYRLKKRLEERLINSFLVMQSNGNALQENYKDIVRKIATAKILVSQEKSTLAKNIIEKELEKAINFEFNDLCFEISKILRRHYSIVEFHEGSGKKYRNLAKKFRLILMEEAAAEEVFFDMVAVLGNKKSVSAKEIKIIKKSFEDIKTIHSKTSSLSITSLLAVVTATYYHIIGENEILIKECQGYINHFLYIGEKMGSSFVFYLMIYVVPALIKTNKKKEAKELIAKGLEIVKEGEYNWLFMKQYEVVVELQDGNYEKARYLINQCTQKYEIEERHQEHFLILNAFCAILDDSRPFQFINDVTIYIKDKQGMNFNIYLIKILYYLRQKKYNKLIDLFPAFERYVERYIKVDEHPREFYFAKMILQLEAIHFDLAKAKEIDETKLAKHPYSKSTQDLIVEIIPFEQLWKNNILKYL